MPALVDQLYTEFVCHAEACNLTAGKAGDPLPLKTTLSTFLDNLFCGRDGDDYVSQRWNMALQQSEEGLTQVYACTFLYGLRRLLLQDLEHHYQGSRQKLQAMAASLNLLIDLELAIVNDAYETRFRVREKTSDQLQAFRRMAQTLRYDLIPSPEISCAFGRIRLGRRFEFGWA